MFSHSADQTLTAARNHQINVLLQLKQGMDRFVIGGLDQLNGVVRQSLITTGGEERIKGSLGPGKLADVAVLDRDVFSAPDDDILETRVDLTIVGGKVKFRRAAA